MDGIPSQVNELQEGEEQASTQHDRQNADEIVDIKTGLP